MKTFIIEKRNKKSAKTLAASSSETKTETTEVVEKGEKELKRAKKAKKAATTSEEIKDAEILSESSLSRYLSAMQPFLSARVYKRLLYYATTDGSTPYVAGPRGKSTADSKFTPVKAPVSDSEAEEIAAVTQPTEIKNVELRDYQLAGVAWLVDRYDKGLHCILADEMGLGERTHQTL
jgi:SNF2 family DNA or RNA helicase